MQYADFGIKYAGKRFMKLATGVNFIQLFWYNWCTYRCNLGQNLMQYTDSGINYAGKYFMKLAKGVNFIKLFWGIIDVPIAIT